jgi:hypothetical protein
MTVDKAVGVLLSLGAGALLGGGVPSTLYLFLHVLYPEAFPRELYLYVLISGACLGGGIQAVFKVPDAFQGNSYRRCSARSGEVCARNFSTADNSGLLISFQ